jgi:PhoPQ-activated pathogenicity-related protein
MTKGGVKALDVMQAVVPTYINGNPLNRFMVSGASKRGWTTWLVGACLSSQKLFF